MPPTPTPLPVIQIPDPCHADWDAMTGDDRARFCAHCQRHVHDLSAMRSDEVLDLICRNAGRLCVRFEQAPDGGVKTLDYAAPPKWRVRTRWLVLGVLAALGVSGARAAWQRQQQPPPIMVGVMTAPVTPPPTSAPVQMGQAAPI